MLIFAKFSKCIQVKRVSMSFRRRIYNTTACSTIFAVSSGRGKCGLAVLRISGQNSSAAIKSMTKFPGTGLPQDRRATLVKFYDPLTKEHLDTGMLLWFKGPRSVTGEDCAEFHVHGSTAVVTTMSNALATLDGFRHAEPGEFTKRAFLNGKLNLTEVEGLADLIQSETELQRRQSLRQMNGELSDLYTRWRATIIKCLANVEAFIDFSEDELIEDGILQNTKERIAALASEMKACVQDGRRGERLRDGVNVVIVGRPNVGKSSLLNCISRRPTAIVSPIPGTTRDVIESAVDIGGYPVLFSDTAGLTQSDDVIESEGVRRALHRYEHADVRIVMLEAPEFLHRVDCFINDYINNILSSHNSESSQSRTKENSTNNHINTSSNVSINDLSPLHQNSTERNPFSHNALYPNHCCAKDNESDQITDASNNNMNQCNKYGNNTTNLHFDNLDQNGEKYYKSNDITNLRQNNCDKLNDNSDKSKNITDSHNNFHQPNLITNFHQNNCDKLNDDADKSNNVTDSHNNFDQPKCEHLIVVNKCDLLSQEDLQRLNVASEHDGRVCVMSCVTNDGFTQFLQCLQDHVSQMCGSAVTPSISHSRHRHHLTACIHHLHHFQTTYQDDVVIAAESLRLAVGQIGQITGQIRNDDVLDVLFGDFCIGK